MTSSGTSTITGGTITMQQIIMQQATWNAWNVCFTNNCTTGTWGAWNQRQGSCVVDYVGIFQDTRAAQRNDWRIRELTRAEVEAAEANRLVQREREARRVIEVSLARRRANDLLHRSLTSEQREDLAKKNCFYLDSIQPNGERRRYRIDRGTHGNVKLLDAQGRIIGRYCVQPTAVPVEDAMLAQKLWIETDEPGFLRVANFTPQRAA
jgi:hypothetical protein